MSTTALYIKPGMWFIHGTGLCKIPVGVSFNRNLDQWTLSKVQFPDLEKRTFKVCHYGSLLAALDAALNTADVGRCLRKLETVERSNKETPLDMCGVHYSYEQSRNRHVYKVSNPLGGQSTVYIGTDTTWRQNIDSAYHRAIELRRQFEHQHNVKSYWSRQSCDLAIQPE